MNQFFAHKIIAHRGASAEAPENSLAAIKIAWQQVQAVEIDIRLSADKQIVVIHDASTGRIGDVNLKVKKSSLEKLKLVNIKPSKNLKYKSEKIPTLQEVFNLLPENGKIIVEIKCGSEIINPLRDLIIKNNIGNENIEIISFNYHVLVKLKTLLPNIKMLWLLNMDYYLPWFLVFVNKKLIFKKLQKGKLDGLNVWAGKYLTPPFVNYFKSKGFYIYTYTTNYVNAAKKLFTMGVDAVTTDYPLQIFKGLQIK